MSAIAALLAGSRSRFGAEAAARGRRWLSVSPGSGAGRQSMSPAMITALAAFVAQHPEAVVVGGKKMAASLAAFATQHPELGANAAAGAFRLNEILSARPKWEMKSTSPELKEEMDKHMERMFKMLKKGSGMPSGEATPGNASGGGAAA